MNLGRNVRLPAWALLSVLWAAGCGVTPEEPVDFDDALTGIPSSPNKSQGRSGNCWIYATTAWAESLTSTSSSAPSSGVPNYSTSYLNYWAWYDHITSNIGADGSKAPEFGGWWDLAADLIERYGLVPYNSMNAVAGGESEQAVLAHQRLLDDYKPGGPLSTAAARNDPAVVRARLNHAFRYDDPSWNSRGTTTPAKVLEQVFGARAPRRFAATTRITASPTTSFTVFHPSQLPLHYVAAESAQRLTLADVIGTRDTSDACKAAPWCVRRVGRFAWRAFDLTDAHNVTMSIALQGLNLRMRKAMLQGYPLPLAFWAAESNLNASRAKFEGPLDIQSAAGGHMVVAVDFQVQNAPGFGTLKVGEETSPEQKRAAVAQGAELQFVRTKNSWGGDYARTDLDAAFLFGPPKNAPAGVTAGLSFVALPPGF